MSIFDDITTLLIRELGDEFKGASLDELKNALVRRWARPRLIKLHQAQINRSSAEATRKDLENALAVEEETIKADELSCVKTADAALERFS